MPMLDKLHHIAFVVRDLDACVRHYERLLGLPVEQRGPVPHRRAEVAIFRLRNVRIEFVAPAAPDSPLHDHLAARGEGFFHLGFGVDDVVVASAELERRGFPMASEPHTGYKDWLIAYLAPEAAGPAPLHVINDDAQ